MKGFTVPHSLGSRQVFVVISTLLLAGFASAGTWWLFRAQVIDNPALGRIVYHYRWGCLAYVTIDTNRDGTDDARYSIVKSQGGRSSTSITLSEGWESTRRNGEFDLHFWIEGGNGVLHLERDLNGDGKFDLSLKGGAAEAELASIGGTSLSEWNLRMSGSTN